MLLTKEATIVVNTRNCEHFRSLGYNVSVKDVITVPIEELTKGTRYPVVCTCDYCGYETSINYKEYLRNTSGIVPKYACKKCKGKKTSESNLITYGVRRPSELPEIKEKVKETNRERFGADYYNQTQECKDRTRKTNMEKYGVPTTLLNPETKEKIQSSLIEHYGVDHPSKSPQIIEKTHQTWVNKYGVDNPSQLQEIKDKKEQTFLKNWGTKQGLSNKEIRDKGYQTMIDKYGVDNPMKSSILRQKAIETNYKRYGVASPLQNKQILKKAQETNLIRYNCKTPIQAPEIRRKAVKTFTKNQTVYTSRQQRYIAELFNMPLNAAILYWNVDMYDKENNAIWEYDGGGHSLCVTLGKESEQEFVNKQVKREIVLRKNGYKIVRIISKKDFIPSDIVLLKMRSDAYQYFIDYPEHTWINFYIDDGMVRNAENKNGMKYDYGKLRKIKD